MSKGWQVFWAIVVLLLFNLYLASDHADQFRSDSAAVISRL